MHKYKIKLPRLARLSDGFLPLALLCAALAGRNEPVLSLFIALYGVKLCALASADGLRMAFARQPSMRYVQGSALMALLAQPVGAVFAALLARLTVPDFSLWILGCGLLLNIEHVFYEYLYAVGDGSSAMLCRGLTAMLTLTGALLCAPAGALSLNPAWPLITSGLSALVGLVICLALGGKLRPRFGAELPRCCGVSLIRSGLYPLAALALSRLLPPAPIAAPLCAGLLVCELCRTPFRRSASESGPMNLMLLVACAAASLTACGLLLSHAAGSAAQVALYSCYAVALGALCAFALYGAFPGREAEAL